MHKAQEQVRTFKFEVAKSGLISPLPPRLRNAEHHARHILEEAVETAVGLVGRKRAQSMLADRVLGMVAKPDTEPDLVEVVDGLCDEIYVCYNAAESIGIDLEPYFDLVHGANMKKVYDPGSWKSVVKPAGWQDPKKAIRSMLELDQRDAWERRYRR